MKYRQWKKNYKKRYGVNPPASIDKRKQRKAAAGTVCRNAADYMQPLEIKENVLSWEVRPVVCDYGVYENNALNGNSVLKLITNSRRVAEKIAEIM